MPPIVRPASRHADVRIRQLAVINLLPPVERTNVLGGATWQFNADHQLFAQYLYAYDRYVLIRNFTPPPKLSIPPVVRIVYPAGGPFYPTEFAAAHGISGDLNLYYRTFPLGPITDR